MIEEEPEDWNVLPVGTEIFSPNELNEVILRFPDIDAAIFFHEFVRSWCADEIRLEVVKS
jgi:hypothetical protein